MATSLDKKFLGQYGDWALITGATSGIGAELADQIAAKGLNILLVARKEKELTEYAERLTAQYSVETRTLSADLATQEGIDKVKGTELEIGLLVLAAGLEVNGGFDSTPVEKERKVLALNVNATFELAHHFSPKMVERGRGGLLLIASLSGQMPNPYFANYAGTKAYVLNLAASLHGEFKRKGVDVTVLSPGLTKTPMVADNGMDWGKTPMVAMDPAEVAALGLGGLGKRLLTVPGFRNKAMALVMKLSPIGLATKMSEMMVRNAIDPDKI